MSGGGRNGRKSLAGRGPLPKRPKNPRRGERLGLRLLARGDFNLGSDVDVFLVAENLPAHLLARNGLLFQFRPPGVEHERGIPRGFGQKGRPTSWGLCGIASSFAMILGLSPSLRSSPEKGFFHSERKSAERRRTRSGSTGFSTSFPSLSQVPTMNPSASL